MGGNRKGRKWKVWAEEAKVEHKSGEFTIKLTEEEKQVVKVEVFEGPVVCF